MKSVSVAHHGGGVFVLDDEPGKDIIERAEDLILRLREVHSARIYTDEQGNITEIHVVAATDRAPKLIARDVETCLKASLGLSVDYRKIGVVVVDPSKEASVRRDARAEMLSNTDEEAHAVVDLEEVLGEEHDENPHPETPTERETAKLEFLEEDARVRFKSLSMSIEEEKIDVEVKLEKSGLVVTGSQGDLRYRGTLSETIAGAAIHAIMELLDENIHLCLSGIEEVVVEDHTAMCAVVHAVHGRSVTSYGGCALIGQDRNESTVLAVLDALNRPLGKWKLRKEIHYTIR
jgi:hypothetical protein